MTVGEPALFEADRFESAAQAGQLAPLHEVGAARTRIDEQVVDRRDLHECDATRDQQSAQSAEQRPVKEVGTTAACQPPSLPSPAAVGSGSASRSAQTVRNCTPRSAAVLRAISNARPETSTSVVSMPRAASHSAVPPVPPARSTAVGQSASSSAWPVTNSEGDPGSCQSAYFASQRSAAVTRRRSGLLAPGGCERMQPPAVAPHRGRTPTSRGQSSRLGLPIRAGRRARPAAAPARWRRAQS